MPQGERAAQKAVQLDDSLAEAHNSMAAAYFFDRWSWVDAERESARAVELNPGFAEAHRLRSYILSTLNRMDEALQEQRKAMELDPFAEPDGLGWALLRARQFDAAMNEARIRIGAQPNSADLHALLSDAYFYKGMEKESEQESERYLTLSGEKELAAAEQRAFGRGGFQAALEWNLNQYQQKAAKQYVTPTRLAGCYAQLRRREETLRYLEQAYEEHATNMVWLQNVPVFDFVHSDRRYRAIVKKMGLPPAY